MGQKVNPNILRLGVNKNWKTEFFEKKTQEFPYFTFIDLEIKSYLERFLNSNGFILHDYKIHYNDYSVNIFLSYAIKSNFKFNLTKQNPKLKLINKKNKQKIVNLNNKSKFLKLENNTFPFKKINEHYKIKKYLKKFSYYSNLSKIERIKKNLFYNNLKIENSIKKLIKGLQCFKNRNIFINLNCVNNNLNLNIKQKKTLRKKIMTLQKFRSASFFKEGINLMFFIISTKNSAKLLSKFIALEFKKIKRHKFFMTFLKKTLSMLLYSDFSKVTGIRIKIKGRLNGAPRAKHKIIDVGNIPIQSISSNIDYSENSIHNSNGSYGIKVYIVEKN